MALRADRVQQFISNNLGYKLHHQQGKDANEDERSSANSYRNNSRKTRAIQYSTSERRKETIQDTDKAHPPDHVQGSKEFQRGQGQQPKAEEIQSEHTTTDGAASEISYQAVSTAASTSNPHVAGDDGAAPGARESSERNGRAVIDSYTDQTEGEPSTRTASEEVTVSDSQEGVADSIKELDLIEQRIEALDETLKGI